MMWHMNQKNGTRVMDTTKTIQRIINVRTLVDDISHFMPFNCKTDEIKFVFYLILLRTRVLLL